MSCTKVKWKHKAGYIRAAALMLPFGYFRAAAKVTASRQNSKSALRYPRLEPYAKVKKRINNSGPSPRRSASGGVALRVGMHRFQTAAKLPIVWRSGT